MQTHRKEECKSELIKELGHEFPTVFIEVKYYYEIQQELMCAPRC
jgi:hypothetical protein